MSDVVNVAKAPDTSKAIRVEVGESFDQKSQEKLLRISFSGPRGGADQGLTLDEAERLFYKLKWALQTVGIQPDGPYLYEVDAEIQPRWDSRAKNPKPTMQRFYILANNEDRIRDTIYQMVRTSSKITRVKKADHSGTSLKVRIVKQNETAPQPPDKETPA